MRTTLVLLMLTSPLLAACSMLPNRDPLTIDVAGIEPLQGEGIELRLAVRVRVQNPNDTPVDYTGVALDLDLNGRKLGSGVADLMGTVPRYGEAVLEVPVTISAINMARQALGFMGGQRQQGARNIEYSVRGKFEGGLFGTRRFSDEGTFDLPEQGQAAQPPAPL